MARTLVSLSGIQATKNFIPNPSFEFDAVGSTTLTGWTLNSANTMQVISNSFTKYGSKSLKLQPNGVSNNYFYTDVEYGTNQTYKLTFWAKCTSYTTGQCGILLRNDSFSAFTGSSDQTLPQSVFDWTQYTLTLNVGTNVVGGSAGKVRIIVDYTLGTTPNFVYYLDGFQWERQPAATPYCDGSLGLGYAWVGTAHNSASIRTSRNVIT
jgi:hypothetical protein